MLSRPWAFSVNRVAASPFLSERTRARVYRQAGLELHTEHIGPRCYFHSSDIVIGRETWLNHGVHIENVGRVEIGARAGLGVFVTVLTSDHALGPHEQRFGPWRYEPVRIGDGCWIGARALILAGVTIGNGCLVAAGSVVRSDCEPDGLYGGVPARRLRDLPP